MSYWRCKCGAQNPAQHDVCELCGARALALGSGKQADAQPETDCYECKAIIAKRAERHIKHTTIPHEHCFRCGAHSRDTSEFDLETPCVEDRKVRLCPGCRIGALARRVVGETRDGLCSEPGCRKTVAEHIAEFRAAGEKFTDAHVVHL